MTGTRERWAALLAEDEARRAERRAALLAGMPARRAAHRAEMDARAAVQAGRVRAVGPLTTARVSDRGLALLASLLREIDLAAVPGDQLAWVADTFAEVAEAMARAGGASREAAGAVREQVTAAVLGRMYPEPAESSTP